MDYKRGHFTGLGGNKPGNGKTVPGNVGEQTESGTEIDGAAKSSEGDRANTGVHDDREDADREAGETNLNARRAATRFTGFLILCASGGLLYGAGFWFVVDLLAATFGISLMYIGLYFLLMEAK